MRNVISSKGAKLWEFLPARVYLREHGLSLTFNSASNKSNSEQHGKIYCNHSRIERFEKKKEMRYPFGGWLGSRVRCFVAGCIRAREHSLEVCLRTTVVVPRITRLSIITKPCEYFSISRHVYNVRLYRVSRSLDIHLKYIPMDPIFFP